MFTIDRWGALKVGMKETGRRLEQVRRGRGHFMLQILTIPGAIP